MWKCGIVVKHLPAAVVLALLAYGPPPARCVCGGSPIWSGPLPPDIQRMMRPGLDLPPIPAAVPPDAGMGGYFPPDNDEGYGQPAGFGGGGFPIGDTPILTAYTPPPDTVPPAADIIPPPLGVVLPVPVPEPSSWVVFGVGLVVLAVLRRGVRSRAR